MNIEKNCYLCKHYKDKYCEVLELQPNYPNIGCDYFENRFGEKYDEMNKIIEDLKNSCLAIEASQRESCEDGDIAKAFQLGLAFGFGEKYDEMDRVIKEVKKVIMPQPKIGHWVLTQRDKYIDINCSECGNTRIKEYAYNYTVDEIDMQEIKDLVVTSKMNYCECCGAKMQEVGE